MRRLRALPEVDLGVHLNLSEFAPLAPLGPLEELFPDGRLSSAALGARRRHQEAVAREWSAQVARVRAAGLEPSHLDSHQHLHWRPALLPCFLRVAAETGIRRGRTMGAHRLGVDPVRAMLQRARAARFGRALGRGGVRSTDGFASARVFRALAEAGRVRARSFEVMAHPGNPHDPAYADELSWLASDWPASLPFPVARISWRQLS